MSASLSISRLRATIAAAVIVFSTTTCAFAQEAVTPDVATSVSQQELAEKIQDCSKNLRTEISGVASSVRSMHDELETKIDEKSSSIQKNVSSLRSTTEISALASTLVCAACAILSLLILFKISHLSTNVTALLNMPPPLQTSQPSSQSHNPSIISALSRIEEKLNAVTKQSFIKPVQDAPAAPREITERLSSIEQTLQNLAARKENASAVASNGPDVTSVFWPKSVQNLENFPVWKKQLRDTLAAGNDTALIFASALLEFQTQFSKRDIAPERYAEIANKLGMAAYGFCYSLEKVAEEDRLDIASALLRALKDDAQIHAPAIEIRAFVPNDRLNTDTMEKVDSGSRLTVQRPLSWLIVEKCNGKERILHRAMVITG